MIACGFAFAMPHLRAKVADDLSASGGGAELGSNGFANTATVVGIAVVVLVAAATRGFSVISLDPTSPPFCRDRRGGIAEIRVKGAMS